MSTLPEVPRIEQDIYRDILLPIQSGVGFEKIVKSIDQLVPTIFAPDNRERAVGIHPSELAGCKLKVYFALIGEERLPPPDIEPRLKIGSAIHEIIQNTLRFNGALFYTESEISIAESDFARRYMIRGHCDMGFYQRPNWPGGEVEEPVLGLEIKTGLVPLAPSEAHLVQAAIYQRCLGFKVMWFLYMNRDGDKWKSFLLKEDPERIEQISKLCDEMMERALVRNPPIPSPNWLVCRKSCGFHHLCKPKF